MPRSTPLLSGLLLMACSHLGLPTTERAPAPGIHQTERTVLYEVSGDNLHDLRAAMERIGPIDDGKHQFAHTWGMFAWRYPTQVEESGCRTGLVSVEVEIVQTFPSWTDRGHASGTSVHEWNRWLAATIDHERQHKKILTATAGIIGAQLAALPDAPTCDELRQKAEERGQQLLKEMRRRHTELDRTTRHGTTTGALLPDR